MFSTTDLGSGYYGKLVHKVRLLINKNSELPTLHCHHLPAAFGRVNWTKYRLGTAKFAAQGGLTAQRTPSGESNEHGLSAI